MAQILKPRPNYVDRACDCIEFECIDGNGKIVENLITTQAINVTRPLGRIGFIGGYIPENQSKSISNSPSLFLSKFRVTEGRRSDRNHSFPNERMVVKGANYQGWLCTVQLRQYQEFLKTLIERENARPSFLFSEEFRIEEAAQAFKEFDARKVIKTLFKYDTPKKSLEIKCTMVLIEGE